MSWNATLSVKAAWTWQRVCVPPASFCLYITTFRQHCCVIIIFIMIIINIIIMHFQPFTFTHSFQWLHRLWHQCKKKNQCYLYVPFDERILASGESSPWGSTITPSAVLRRRSACRHVVQPLRLVVLIKTAGSRGCCSVKLDTTAWSSGKESFRHHCDNSIETPRSLVLLPLYQGGIRMQLWALMQNKLSWHARQQFMKHDNDTGWW